MAWSSMMIVDTQPKTLILTIGMGNPSKLEETLYTPLSKSINSGEWDLIILLPSKETLVYAEELARRFPGKTFEIKELSQPMLVLTILMVLYQNL